MKRGTKCIAQTINLSNPETCVRPKRVQKLVSADVAQPCPNSGPGSTSYWSPRPVAVKVCTRKEMSRACPPKLCDCPQKAPPRTAMQKFCAALIFLLKGSIAAGLVYWTNSEGLWGRSTESEELYYRILETIAPALPNRPDVDNISLPRLGSLKYSMIERYNHAVFNVTSTVVDASTRLQQQLRDALFPCEEKDETGEKDASSQS